MAPDFTDADSIIGVRDNGDGTFSDYRFSAAQILEFVINNFTPPVQDDEMAMINYVVGNPSEVADVETKIPVTGPVTLDAIKDMVPSGYKVIAMYIGAQFVEPVFSSESITVTDTNVYMITQKIT